MFLQGNPGGSALQGSAYTPGSEWDTPASRHGSARDKLLSSLHGKGLSTVSGTWYNVNKL